MLWGQPRDFMCSTVHPNLVGHTYMADLLIGWMQTRMVGMLQGKWLRELGGADQPAEMDVRALDSLLCSPLQGVTPAFPCPEHSLMAVRARTGLSPRQPHYTERHDLALPFRSLSPVIL